MTLALILALLGATLVIGVGLALIGRYPRPVQTDVVHCPERNVLAYVTFARGERPWGNIGRVDVVRCSLLPGASVTCDKRCMT